MLKLPKATPPPELTSKQRLLVPFAYLYILALVFLVLWQVISFSSFTSYISTFSPVVNGTKDVVYGVTLLALEVFALPFLFRAWLSLLARFLSALCSLLVPVAWAVVMLVGQPDNLVVIACSFALIVWAALAFGAMGGAQALSPKKP